MATTIIMPQGGQDIAEGNILKWLKAEGQLVRKGEVVCEVETEKAAFEVEAPEDGVLLRIVAPEGERVPIFSVIGIVGQPGEQPTAVAQPAPEPAPASGGLDITAIKRRLGKGADGDGVPARASGRARRIAQELGVDLGAVTGTGPGGRVSERDVLAYAESRKNAAAPAPSQAAPPSPAAPAPHAAAVRGQTVALSKVRSMTAKRMQQSKQTVPHFYVTVSIDMTNALALRDESNSRAPSADAKVSVNDMIAKAAALALAEVPEVNARLEGDGVSYLADVNVGLAVALEDGLVVPVIPRADTLSLSEIAAKTRELIRAAKSGKQANLAAATFTISNMGMLGVDNFVAIINPPESAILAIGSVVKKVVVDGEGALRVRDVMSVTLSADHRALDGATAAQFANVVKANLEEPARLLRPPA